MKALIVGGGVAAEIHCKVLTKLNIEIAGICDLNINAAETLAKQFSAKAYSNLDEALKEEVDFATICTPSGTHPRLAVQIMKAGKNVVIEKPLGLTPEDCDMVVKTAEETGVICAPISQLRFSDMYIKVKEAIESGILGTLVMSSLSMKYFRSREYYLDGWKGTKGMDGGELMNQGIHGIDIMCGLLGRPEYVSGKVTTRYHDIEAEDTAVAHFVFPNGMLGSLDSSTAITKSKPRRFEICGSEGIIVVEEDKIVMAEGLYLGQEKTGEYNGSSDPKDIGTGLHGRNYKNIIAALEGKEKLKYTAKDAADTVKVICAVYKSSETNQPVELKGE